MDRVKVFGEGWIGTRVRRELRGVSSNTDITQRDAVAKLLDHLKPTVVVNCAGKTGRPNVDWCEEHAAETYSSNVGGPVILSEECLARKIFMVHLGSGCIYEGGPETPFTEEDPPNFHGSLYSRSKAVVERALRDLPVLQLRLRMPFDGAPHPRNLITKLLGYRKVISVPNSLTSVEGFIKALRFLIEKRERGVWNVTNPGHITHGRILDLYHLRVDPSFQYELMSLEELADKVKTGRSNCVLDASKLERAGCMLDPVEEAMCKALDQYGRKQS